MAYLIVLNLLSIFTVFPVICFWYSRSFDSSIIALVSSSLAINPLLCFYLHDCSRSHVKRLARATTRVVINLCISIPLFIVLIYSNVIYIRNVNFYLVLWHSVILSTLTLYPSAHNGGDTIRALPSTILASCLRELHSSKPAKFKVEINGRQDPERDQRKRQIDSFVTVNLLLVTLLSWLASFLYGLDKNIDLAHYPIASCLGAIVGSLTINSFYLMHFLFQKYNTLFVY